MQSFDRSPNRTSRHQTPRSHPIVREQLCSLSSIWLWGRILPQEVLASIGGALYCSSVESRLGSSDIRPSCTRTHRSHISGFVPHCHDGRCGPPLFFFHRAPTALFLFQSSCWELNRMFKTGFSECELSGTSACKPRLQSNLFMQ